MRFIPNMEKIRTMISLEPEVKEKAVAVLKEEDKKLSTVVNSFLKNMVKTK